MKKTYYQYRVGNLLLPVQPNPRNLQQLPCAPAAAAEKPRLHCPHKPHPCANDRPDLATQRVFPGRCVGGAMPQTAVQAHASIWLSMLPQGAAGGNCDERAATNTTCSRQRRADSVKKMLELGGAKAANWTASAMAKKSQRLAVTMRLPGRKIACHLNYASNTMLKLRAFIYWSVFRRSRASGVFSDDDAQQISNLRRACLCWKMQ